MHLLRLNFKPDDADAENAKTATVFTIKEALKMKKMTIPQIASKINAKCGTVSKAFGLLRKEELSKKYSDALTKIVRFLENEGVNISLEEKERIRKIKRFPKKRGGKGRKNNNAIFAKKI